MSTVSRTSLGTSGIAGKSLGRVWGPAGWLWSLKNEPWDQQDRCEVPWRCFGISRIGVKSLQSIWDQQYSCDVSMKNLGTSMIAVQFQGRVWGPAG